MGWGLSQIRDLLFGCEYGQGKLKTTELVIADNVKVSVVCVKFL